MIRELLELYFDGETTLEQEKQLRDYFTGCDDIPADLLYAKAMFGGFTLAEQHACSAEVNIPDAKKLPAKRGRLSRIYTSISVAAAVVVAAGLTWVLAPEKQTVYCYLNGEPVTNIEIAARQAQMASRLIETSASVSANNISTFREAGKSMEHLSRIMQFAGQLATEEE